MATQTPPMAITLDPLFLPHFKQHQNTPTLVQWNDTPPITQGLVTQYLSGASSSVPARAQTRVIQQFNAFRILYQMQHGIHTHPKFKQFNVNLLQIPLFYAPKHKYLDGAQTTGTNTNRLIVTTQPKRTGGTTTTKKWDYITSGMPKPNSWPLPPEQWPDQPQSATTTTINSKTNTTTSLSKSNPQPKRQTLPPWPTTSHYLNPVPNTSRKKDSPPIIIRPCVDYYIVIDFECTCIPRPEHLDFKPKNNDTPVKKPTTNNTTTTPQKKIPTKSTPTSPKQTKTPESPKPPHDQSSNQQPDKGDNTPAPGSSDFEKYIQEIIEFPAILVNAHDLTIVSVFHTYVKPTIDPILSDFCKGLTKITQKMVDNAPSLELALILFTNWLLSFGIVFHSSLVDFTQDLSDVASILDLKFQHHFRGQMGSNSNNYNDNISDPDNNSRLPLDQSKHSSSLPSSSSSHIQLPNLTRDTVLDRLLNGGSDYYDFNPQRHESFTNFNKLDEFSYLLKNPGVRLPDAEYPGAPPQPQPQPQPTPQQKCEQLDSISSPEKPNQQQQHNRFNSLSPPPPLSLTQQIELVTGLISTGITTDLGSEHAKNSINRSTNCTGIALNGNEPEPLTTDSVVTSLPEPTTNTTKPTLITNETVTTTTIDIKDQSSLNSSNEYLAHLLKSNLSPETTTFNHFDYYLNSISALANRIIHHADQLNITHNKDDQNDKNQLTSITNHPIARAYTKAHEFDSLLNQIIDYYSNTTTIVSSQIIPQHLPLRFTRPQQPQKQQQSPQQQPQKQLPLIPTRHQSALCVSDGPVDFLGFLIPECQAKGLSWILTFLFGVSEITKDVSVVKCDGLSCQDDSNSNLSRIGEQANTTTTPKKANPNFNPSPITPTITNNSKNFFLNLLQYRDLSRVDATAHQTPNYFTDLKKNHITTHSYFYFCNIRQIFYQIAVGSRDTDILQENMGHYVQLPAPILGPNVNAVNTALNTTTNNKTPNNSPNADLDITPIPFLTNLFPKYATEVLSRYPINTTPSAIISSPPVAAGPTKGIGQQQLPSQQPQQRHTSLINAFLFKQNATLPFKLFIGKYEGGGLPHFLKLFEMTFIGQLHCGLVDALNITRLLYHILFVSDYPLSHTGIGNI